MRGINPSAQFLRAAAALFPPLQVFLPSWAAAAHPFARLRAALLAAPGWSAFHRPTCAARRRRRRQDEQAEAEARRRKKEACHQAQGGHQEEAGDQAGREARGGAPLRTAAAAAVLRRPALPQVAVVSPAALCFLNLRQVKASALGKGKAKAKAQIAKKGKAQNARQNKAAGAPPHSPQPTAHSPIACRGDLLRLCVTSAMF